MFVGRSACPEPRREPAFALRPGHPSQRKNPLSRLFPLDSVHSPVSPLFPLHTRNIGGGASPEIRGTRPQPITNTIVTQQVSNVRRQFKYYLNCRHADNLECGAWAPLLPCTEQQPKRAIGSRGLQGKSGSELPHSKSAGIKASASQPRRPQKAVPRKRSTRPRRRPLHVSLGRYGLQPVRNNAP